ncbi:MAG: hypothetical protein WCD18_04905 [Thermosynechococcaceae cyanobacterium]
MVTRRTYDYDEATYPPVLANDIGLRSPNACVIDPAYMTASAGARGITQKLIPPGAFAGTIDGSDNLRVLPRTRVVSEATAGVTTLTVTPKTARFFIPGDDVVVVFPYHRLNFALTWANGDTLTITLNGLTYSHTVSGFSTLTALAASVVAGLQADSLFDDFDFVSVAAAIHITTPSTDPFLIVVTSTTAGNGTLLLLGGGESGTGSRYRVLGTVASVDPVLDTITLDGAIATATIAGLVIGADGSYPMRDRLGLGLLTPSLPHDLLYGENNNLALFVGATVIKSRLPHFDHELAQLFPNLVFS